MDRRRTAAVVDAADCRELQRTARALTSQGKKDRKNFVDVRN